MVSEDETAVPDNVAPQSASEDEPTDRSAEQTAAKTKPAAGRRGPRQTLAEVVSYFAPCGRCGFFLAGYRAANGLDNLETAVNQSKSGWIVLSWNLAVRELVLKSYGCRIEADDLHYEGCCSECRRHFIFRASRNPNDPDTLRIEIKPRKRQ